RFSDPAGIALSTEGVIFVCDSGNYRIQAFTVQGEFLYALDSGADSFDKPRGIIVDRSGNILFSDDSARVYKYSPDGVLMADFGVFGEKQGELRSPAGLSVGREGMIYVADSYNHRIQRFRREQSYSL
ncbi:MAG: NHL repeat containing protein, partial [Candidatus Adlerbacteria bacterium GW2011_GWB1_54_7]